MMYISLSLFFFIGDFPDTEEVDTSSESHWWLWLMEDNKARQAFRILSLANLVLLLLSLPFFTISEPEDHHKLQVQFIIVTALDAILSLLYTFHLLIRTRYFIFSHSKSVSGIMIKFCVCVWQHYSLCCNSSKGRVYIVLIILFAGYI